MISPPNDDKESVMIFNGFECGNAKYLFNLKINYFDDNDPESFIGVVFRYINIDGMEEY